jgi:hypothetical protein
MKLKPLVAGAVLSVAAFSASAFDVGVVGGGTTGSNNGELAGVTFGQKWDRVGLEAGFAQAWLSRGDQNRWTAVGSYDVYQSKNVVVAGKLGYAYLDQRTNSGSAGLVGVGLEFPVTKQFSLTADYAYQFAQNSSENTNVITGGMKYRF